MSPAVKMNPAVKKKWVAALRSGRYKQTRGKLRSGQGAGRCCLGVLCDLAVDAGVIGAPVLVEKGHWDYDGQHTEPGSAVTQWAGLARWGSNEVTIGKTKRALAMHNDAGRKFAEIADAIEAEL